MKSSHRVHRYPRENAAFRNPLDAFATCVIRAGLFVAATLGLVIYSGDTGAVPPILFDGADGATCEYFNQGARIKWRQRLGDWTDVKNAQQGGLPFAEAAVRAVDTGRVVSWDVTKLVRGGLSGTHPMAGMVIFSARGSPASVSVFHSREAPEARLRPALLLTLADGTTRRLSPIADTTLDCTTVASIGSRTTLAASIEQRLLIQFDLGPIKGLSLLLATLELVTTDRQYGDARLGVFNLDPPVSTGSPEGTPQPGIAARYPRDAGIERDAAVVMATGFESALWWTDWSYSGFRSSSERINEARALGFQPLEGHALMVKIPSGKNLGLDMGYKFADKLGHEPEEIYFRYYLRLASDWNPTTDGGKLPGISATYGRAGWGGRKADASMGWSMRGSFFRLPDPGSPYRELTPIGTYAYHADTEDFWGDPWAWTNSGQALLERNRWYCIEQYIKVNRIGQKDAVFRGWVDGRLVFESTGFRVRDTTSIRIEQIWMNVYYGGTAPSPSDQHLFIDNVVIARDYIGPIAR